ncbi:hypothetical protein NEUTE2DRAFT_162152 [Neurospora tetrasperma FGSC 2509]|nr:hypothetical protein NEUTE2DRAFT_162152 [Neurospora tetrasperma FGSC 2509]
MLPSNLYSTYRQYKHDTDVVASWLAQTGKTLGCAAELIASNSASPANPNLKSARLKGKARKSAKLHAAAEARWQAKGLSERQKYVLALKNFVPLAEFIGTKLSEARFVEIPAVVPAAIERAITVRKGFARLLQEHGRALKLESNENHSYFVSVLEKVRHILEPLFKDSWVRRALPKLPKTTTSTNPFDLLEFYDAPDFDLAGDSTGNSKEAAKGKETVDEGVIVDYEAEDSASSLVAFATLFRDVRALRMQVRSLWAAYAKGELSLPSVAVATNAAINIARFMEEDAADSVRLNRDKKTPKDWALFYCQMAASSQGIDVTERTPGCDINLSAFPMLDESMTIAFILLEAWISQARASSEVVTYNGKFGWYDLTIDYDSAPTDVKWQQDKAAFLEVAPQFDLMGRFNTTPPDALPEGLYSDMPVEDELLRGLRLLLTRKEKVLPFWLAFATTIHLDSEKPFWAMMRYNMAIDDSITQNLEYYENLTIKGWEQMHGDRQLIKLQNEARWFTENPLYKVIESTGLLTSRNNKEHTFLKMHPLFCGLWIHYIRTTYHLLATQFERCWGGILYTGHLYNALCNEDLIDDAAKWDDMDLFYRLQGGKDKFFVGAAPTERDSYHKQLCMMMGFSATSFIASTRNKTRKLVPTKAGPRSLVAQGKVSSMFHNQYRPSMEGIKLSVDDVQAILNKKSQNPQKTPQATPSQLIHQLALDIEAEISETSVDYLAMHRQCWDFLRSLEGAVDPYFRRVAGPGWIEREHQLPFVVGYIFSTVLDPVGGESKMTEFLVLASKVYKEAVAPYRKDVTIFLETIQDYDKMLSHPEDRFLGPMLNELSLEEPEDEEWVDSEFEEMMEDDREIDAMCRKFDPLWDEPEDRSGADFRPNDPPLDPRLREGFGPGESFRYSYTEPGEPVTMSVEAMQRWMRVSRALERKPSAVSQKDAEWLRLVLRSPEFQNTRQRAD